MVRLTIITVTILSQQNRWRISSGRTGRPTAATTTCGALAYLALSRLTGTGEGVGLYVLGSAGGMHWLEDWKADGRNYYVRSVRLRLVEGRKGGRGEGSGVCMHARVRVS